MDLLLLGIGANAHIGFNEPARILHARSHKTRLALANAPRERRRSSADGSIACRAKR